MTDLHAALAALQPHLDRRPDSPPEEGAASWAQLGTLDGAGVFVSRFAGRSAWERHPMGEELVQVIAGCTVLRILGGDPETQTLQAGAVVVVPKGAWHQFHAPEGVSLFTVTPLPTEHSAAQPAAD